MNPLLFQTELGQTDSLDWDQGFTEQVLQSMDAIEATLQPSVATSSSTSLMEKRKSSIPDQSPATRRHLPISIVGPPRSLSPCQANPRMRFPALRFGGHIWYSRTAENVEEAAEKLLEHLESKKKEDGQAILGLDIEWKPSFRRGISPGKAAVIQICCDTSICYVMHIIHSGIPQCLQFLLEDSSILKVGVAIGGDTMKIFKDYNVSVRAAEDIQALANKKLGGGPFKWSLSSLTKELVSKELLKSNKIRLGNWEADNLSKQQLEYAATDAFASWHIYQVLKRLPDLDTANNANEEVKDPHNYTKMGQQI